MASRTGGDSSRQQATYDFYRQSQYLREFLWDGRLREKGP